MITGFFRTQLVAAVIVLFCMGGCDDNRPGTLVGGGSIVPSPLVAASFVPTAIGFDTLPVFSCPAIAPFRSTVSVFIDQRGGVDVTLNEALFEFVDGSGFGSKVFFGQQNLNSMFGIPFIASGTSRLFTFQPAFGCGFLSRPRSLSARLLLVDRAGRRQTPLLNAVLR